MDNTAAQRAAEEPDDDEYDEDEYDEDEEYEDDDEIEAEDNDPPAGARGGPAAAMARRVAERPAPAEWKGLSTFAQQTQLDLNALVNKVRNSGQKEVTIMLVGKNGVGKSSLANAIFGERVFQVNVFQNSGAACKMESRTVSGFVLTIIDTPGLVDEDGVSAAALASISQFLTEQDKAVDAMLYVDRLDGYHVSNVDKAIIEALTATFGSSIWDISILTCTHGQLAPPNGKSYEEFTNDRLNALAAAVKANGNSVPRSALVENGSRCAVNSNNEKILPDKTVWLTSLVSQVVDIVTGEALSLLHDGSMEDIDVYAKKRRWMIWPALLLEVLVLKPLMVNLIRKDPDPDMKFKPTKTSVAASELASA